MEACTQKGQTHKQGHTQPEAWGGVGVGRVDSIRIQPQGESPGHPGRVTSGTLTLQTG